MALAVPAASAAGTDAGTFSFGAGLGFLANTTDDTAFALNAQGDYFIKRDLSVGPLVQLAFTGDLAQVGTSAQARYWWPVPGSPLARLVFQGGVGVVHADHAHDDTSFLIPLGLSLDYEMNRDMSMTATFLVNFTNLDTGPGQDTTIMPGLTLGVRF